MSNQTPESTSQVPTVSRETLRDKDFRSLPLNNLSSYTAPANAGENDGKEESGTSDSKVEPVVNAEGTSSEAGNTSSTEGTERKGGKNLAKKMAKLVAENSTLLARLDALEAATRKPADVKPAEAVKPAEFKFDKPKPKMGDFKDVVEYTEAVSEWTYEKNRARDQAESAQKQHQEEANKKFNTFWSEGKKIEKTLGLDPGEFEATVRSEDFLPHAISTQELAESEVGAEIAYQIASDDELKEKFNSYYSTPAKQVKLIGQLEAAIIAKRDASSSNGGNGFNNKVSKAQPVGGKIKGSSNGVKFDKTRTATELTAMAAGQIKTAADYRRFKAQSR